MNNTKKMLGWLLLGSSLLGACKKQFLELTPYSQVPLNQAIVDENSMQTAVNGMYAGLRATDFYGRSIPIDGDLLADNVYISASNSNRYLIELTYTYIPTSGDQQNTWAEGYAVILRANDIINANLPSSSTVNELVGEALTMRAFVYFELLKFYAPPYLVDSTALGVPLVLQYDPLLTPARNTVAEVYAQIESDLTKAIGLTTEVSNSSIASKYVAEGLLARMYMFKGEYANAQASALDIVNNGGYSLTSANSLVNYWSATGTRSDLVETMFEVEFDITNNNSTDNLDAFYSQAGYGDALCTDNLYNTYSATDARQALIISGTRAGVNVWVVNKYPNTTNPGGTDNTKVLRYAEILLTLAETYNRSGDDLSAQGYVNQVAQTRDPSFPGYTATGTALLSDIILERRKEFAFEGQRYWDLVRLNMDVVRDNTTGNYLQNVPLTLPASDHRRIFPIPQAEINANKNMKQNAGY
jgi:starch-binding outer membrane protein, SusD/RagB family